jgi:ribonuclease HI
MSQVNIYLYATVRSPRKCDGAYVYMLETETGKGLVKRSGTELIHEKTAHQADLCALAAAVKRLTKPCTLTIYTDSKYLATAAEKWMGAWKANGWKTAKGTPVANAEEWREVAHLLNGHDFSFVVGAYHFHYFDMKKEAEKAAAECTK